MSKEPQIKIIKTIPVVRTIEKEIIVKKKIKEEVQVGIHDLTEDDIYALKSIDITKAIANGFRTLYNESMGLNRELVETAQQMAQARERPEPTHNTQPFNLTSIGNEQVKKRKTVTKHPRSNTLGSGNSGHTIGKKVGITSKYHYVFFDNTQQCWKCNFESKGYESEIEAAIVADKFTKKMNRNDGKKRPLNKNEFEEVADAFGTK